MQCTWYHIQAADKTKPVNSDNDHRPTAASYVSSATSGSSCCKVLSQLTNQGAYSVWLGYVGIMLECLALCNQKFWPRYWFIRSKAIEWISLRWFVRHRVLSCFKYFQMFRRLHRWKSLLEFSQNDIHAAASPVQWSWIKDSTKEYLRIKKQLF